VKINFLHTADPLGAESRFICFLPSFEDLIYSFLANPTQIGGAQFILVQNIVGSGWHAIYWVEIVLGIYCAPSLRGLWSGVRGWGVGPQ